ncbi:helix-turn-helix domain-containing protein [Haloarculaceae archaeon H-GB2-1]|nr:helix-turn-helix domain-containing protein [Haloarculaceae archaeon H-GB1-1]MEA5385880.1 helix-turn-helix domain-containing protein [Haloarculaceae archaeon H-GB11]MEA5407386.1 helix-turn-helix domain-containing protein [Haloarculaceae archaeon H-GB2-1]
MSNGIRVVLSLSNPRHCPVAAASAQLGDDVHDVSLSSGGDTVTEEFATAGEFSHPKGSLERVFEAEGNSVYRFERTQGVGCPCERIDEFDVPVSTVDASDGDLSVTFYAPDVETVHDIVSSLQEVSEVTVHQLSTAGPDADGDPVFVDRSLLTARQREVLETAHEMGFFDYPDGANASEVAEDIGISRSTFSEHLATAQTKLLNAILAA